MKCRDASPFLVEALQNEVERVRTDACLGLAWLADFHDLDKASVAALKARDRPGERFGVRLQAAAALLEIGGPTQEPAILHGISLRNPEADTALAAHALAAMGRTETIELMIGQIDGQQPAANGKLLGALWQLTGQRLGSDPTRWRAWLEKNRDKLPEQLR